MTSYHTDGKVGEWAQDKLDCLGKYLHAYTTIMKSQTWCEGYYYIDAFAGTGRSEIRKRKGKNPENDLISAIAGVANKDKENIEFVNGSPRVALDLKFPFTKYFFIEKIQKRIAGLNSLKIEYGASREIEIIQGEADTFLNNFLTHPKINWTKNRAFIFLDPFGMQVAWPLIARIAKSGKCEIMLNFPVGHTIQRKLLRSGKFCKVEKEKLDHYLGSSEWFDILYRTNKDLFEKDVIEKMDKSGKLLANWYRARLLKLFKYCPEPILILNNNGSYLYYLIFAGNNKQAAKIISHVFSKQEIKIYERIKKTKTKK